MPAESGSAAGESSETACQLRGYRARGVRGSLRSDHAGADRERVPRCEHRCRLRSRGRAVPPQARAAEGDLASGRAHHWRGDPVHDRTPGRRAGWIRWWSHRLRLSGGRRPTACRAGLDSRLHDAFHRPGRPDLRATRQVGWHRRLRPGCGLLPHVPAGSGRALAAGRVADHGHRRPSSTARAATGRATASGRRSRSR